VGIAFSFEKGMLSDGQVGRSSRGGGGTTTSRAKPKNKRIGGGLKTIRGGRGSPNCGS
jgi:hypothetical protein